MYSGCNLSPLAYAALAVRIDSVASAEDFSVRLTSCIYGYSFGSMLGAAWRNIAEAVVRGYSFNLCPTEDAFALPAGEHSTGARRLVER